MNRDKVLELAQQAELARQFALEVPFVVDRLERFAALIEAEVRGDAEPVAWMTFDGEGGYEYRSYEENENYAEQWTKRNPNYVGWVKPLYEHHTHAVVAQLVDGLAGLIDFIEIDNLKIDQDALRIAKAALAAVKEA